MSSLPKLKCLLAKFRADAAFISKKEDVFYFGNAIGETGDSTGNAFVNAMDTGGVRNNPRNFMNPAPIHDPYDFNRDRNVNALDFGIARNHATNFITALKLITTPSD